MRTWQDVYARLQIFNPSLECFSMSDLISVQIFMVCFGFDAFVMLPHARNHCLQRQARRIWGPEHGNHWSVSGQCGMMSTPVYIKHTINKSWTSECWADIWFISFVWSTSKAEFPSTCSPPIDFWYCFEERLLFILSLQENPCITS